MLHRVFVRTAGSWIAHMIKGLISGIMQKVNLDALMIACSSSGGDVGQIFRVLSHQRINIEFVSQLACTGGFTRVVICVERRDTSTALAALEEKKPLMHAEQIAHVAQAGILSVFPHREHAFVIGLMVHGLAAHRIPILAMGSSISAVSCVVRDEQVTDAIRFLSREFGLA